MKYPSDIITPPTLDRRPKDHRGYPVPFVSHDNGDGTYDFRAIDYPTVVECARRRLCGLCGEHVGYRIAFVGGPLAIKNRCFNDPGMHEDCAHYAMIVCPFLAMSATVYARRLPLPVVATPGQVLYKPPAPLMAITRNYDLDARTGNIKISKPVEVRVYPYDTAGAWYEPSPEVFAGLVEESVAMDRANQRPVRYSIDRDGVLVAGAARRR